MSDYNPYRGHLDAIKSIFVPESARVVPLATLRRLAALLERAEWLSVHDTNYDYPWCAACDAVDVDKHRPDCELAALRRDLAALLGEAP